MTSPTQIIIPGADFSAAPAAWILPTSVAPSYLGVYGDNLPRTLQNGARIGAVPCDVAGSAPILSPGYASFTHVPEQGILTNELEVPNWTWMAVFQGVALTTFQLNLWGDRYGTPQNQGFDDSTITVNNGVVSLTQFTAGGAVQANLFPTLSILQQWNIFVFTGQSGVNVTGQMLTVGQDHSIANTPTASAFIQTTDRRIIGTGPGQTGTPGSLNIAMVGVWSSVLSSNDQTLAAGWMRKLAAKNGITV